MKSDKNKQNPKYQKIYEMIKPYLQEDDRAYKCFTYIICDLIPVINFLLELHHKIEMSENSSFDQIKDNEYKVCKRLMAQLIQNFRDKKGF